MSNIMYKEFPFSSYEEFLVNRENEISMYRDLFGGDAEGELVCNDDTILDQF